MAGGASIAVVWTGRPCYSVTLLKTLKHTLLHCVTLWHSPNQCNTLPLLHCVVLHCVLREVGRTQSVISCEHRGSSLSSLQRVEPAAADGKSANLRQLVKITCCSPLWVTLLQRERDKDSRLRAEKQEKRRNKRKGETGGNRTASASRSLFFSPLLFYFFFRISLRAAKCNITVSTFCIFSPPFPSVSFRPPPFYHFPLFMFCLSSSICFRHFHPPPWERKSLPPRIDGFLENWRHFVAL